MTHSDREKEKKTIRPCVQLLPMFWWCLLY